MQIVGKEKTCHPKKKKRFNFKPMVFVPKKIVTKFPTLHILEAL